MLQQTKGNPQFACCVSSRTTNTLVLLHVIGHPAQRVLVSVSTLLAMRCRPTRHTALEAGEREPCCIASATVHVSLLGNSCSCNIHFDTNCIPRPAQRLMTQSHARWSAHCCKFAVQIQFTVTKTQLSLQSLHVSAICFVRTCLSRRRPSSRPQPASGSFTCPAFHEGATVMKEEYVMHLCTLHVGVDHSPGARIARKHEIFRPHAKLSLNFSLCGKRQSENTVQRQMLCQGSFVVLSQRGAHFRVG